MNVTNFISINPNNLASQSSRTCILNPQFSNMYHYFSSDPRYSQFPLDCRFLPTYPPYFYSMPEPYMPNALINPSGVRFPSVASFTQAPVWQNTTPTNLEDGTRLLKTERISPVNEAPAASSQPTNSPPVLQSREKNSTKRKKKIKRTIQDHIPKKDWKKEDADLALKTELKFGIAKKKQQIIIKFPDEELNSDVVKKFHQGIKFVHFQTSCGPRYCFAQIEENVNINSVIQTLNEMKFQNGYLKAERKIHKEEDSISAEEIDPYTLYLGNLPQNVTSHSVKGKFKKASRIDIGFAQKIKFTRYAFIRFKNVHDAVEAYKENLDMVIDNRSVVLRFRRINVKETDPTKTKKVKLEEDQDPIEDEVNEYLENSENKASEKEDFSHSTPSPVIKTEKTKGYADEVTNKTSSSLNPYFGTLLKRKNEDFMSKFVNFFENSNGIQMSENLSKCTNENQLRKFISYITGVPGISDEDAEIFKTIVLKLADIFKHSKVP